MAHWYYSISPSNYGEWTVTATLGTDTVSGTMVIGDIREYDIKFLYGYYFYKSGYMDSSLACVKFAGSNGGQSLVNENNVLTLFNNYTGGSTALTWFTGIQQKIDVTDYTLLKLVVQSRTEFSTSACTIGLFSNPTSYNTISWAARTTLPSRAISSTETYTVDISTISGSYYVGLVDEVGLYVPSMTMEIEEFGLEAKWYDNLS